MVFIDWLMDLFVSWQYWCAMTVCFALRSLWLKLSLEEARTESRRLKADLDEARAQRDGVQRITAPLKKAGGRSDGRD